MAFLLLIQWCQTTENAIRVKISSPGVFHGIKLAHTVSVLWRCWLHGRKGIQPVKIWVVRYWCGYLSGVRCKWFEYGPPDATAIPSSLASVKSKMVYISAAGLPRLSWKKSLNGCSVVIVVNWNTVLTSGWLSVCLVTWKLKAVGVFSWNLGHM